MRRLWFPFLLLLAATAPSFARAADSETQLIDRRTSRLAHLPPAPTPPTVTGPTNNPIDQFIVDAWQKAGLPEAKKPPELCDDATFARRVHLDLLGVIPSFVELNRFLADSSKNKREKLIELLLARKSEYAAHWAPFWEDALASQNVLTQGGIITRGNYRDWIVQSFEKNRPYDVMVAELIDPTMPGRQGAKTQDVLGVQYKIEYVRNEDHMLTLQTASNVGQVFLGTGMKCAGCHDHFENKEWTQDRFLGFAGLFAAKDLEHIRCDVKSGRLVPAKFPFQFAGATEEPPTDLNGRLHLAAMLITDPANPRFAETIVNRLWKRYLGTGLYEPVDDYRADLPASHPELLAWLARDFMAHGCDLQHTIRLIVSSRTYQLRYDAKLADKGTLDGKSPRYFRSPSLRRLTAEQFIDSVRMATFGQVTPGERNYLDIRSTALTRALGRPASRNEISTSRPDDVAVVQSLELLNGKELHEMIYESPLVGKPLPRGDLRPTVDRIYRTALTRPATADERRIGRDFLQTAATPGEGVGDLLWALFAGPEFQYVR